MVGVIQVERVDREEVNDRIWDFLVFRGQVKGGLIKGVEKEQVIVKVWSFEKKLFLEGGNDERVKCY